MCFVAPALGGGGEKCSLAQVRMSDVHQYGAIKKVWLLQILLNMKNLLVHIILHQILSISNKISSNFHICDEKGCMSCKSGGTSCRFPGKFSSEGLYLWGGE